MYQCTYTPLYQVKKASTPSGTAAAQRDPRPAASASPAEQKKKAGLRAKAARHKGPSEGPVLGGADYVELLMGSRKRAKAEAAKLPKDS